MKHTFASAFVLLLLVLDPFGSLPVFVTAMRRVAPERRMRVALRESGIALAILLCFMFAGSGFLELMHLSERSLEVAGGVILLIIAIKMIFSDDTPEADGHLQREPLVFPIAVPMLAGPSAMATVLLLASNQPQQVLHWALALALAVAVCGIVLLSADAIRRTLGGAVVAAIEKLMGLVLSALAVEMILAGLKRYFFAA